MRRPPVLAAVLLAALALLAAGCGGKGAAGSESEIAFVTSRDGDYAIYGMRADGSGEGRLTAGGDEEGTSPAETFFQTEPGWSPDGSKIVFASLRDGRPHIYVMAAGGSGTTQLTSGKHEDTAPAWSPDGRWIAFARDNTLFVMTPEGKELRRVTTTLGGEEREPSWSPDGKWIAFVRREPEFTSREIWRVRSDGSDLERLTRLDASSYGPAWSQDGTRIVFVSNANDDRYQIYEIGATGKGLRRLTFQPGEYFDPSWSVDGKTLIFEHDGRVYTIVHGGSENALTDGPNDGSPTWRPVVPASK
ncbi:MAG: DPP IV N-terminal domain-containing protein [Gaiellaceae bacterium]